MWRIETAAFWKIVKYVGILLFLLICSIQDIKEKRLSIKVLVIFGILFLGGSLLWDGISFHERIWNMLPGAAMLLIAFLTKEQIGYGDGACLLVLGNVVSFVLLLRALMTGLVLLSVCGLALFVGKKADWKTTLPMLPYLTAGYLLQIFITVFSL